jgi:hypothetical protein
MAESKQTQRQGSVQWTVQHTVIWQTSEAEPYDDSELQAERYRAQMKRQGIDDAVFEREATTPRNVDVEHAHRVADEDWETGETDETEAR